MELLKNELLAKVPNSSENELRNTLLNHEKFSNEKDILVGKISENRTKLELRNQILQELEKTRKKTLSQFLVIFNICSMFLVP